MDESNSPAPAAADAPEPSTENIVGGENTTPEEVAQILNLPQDESTDEEAEEPVADEEEPAEEPGEEPADEEPKEETPAEEVTPTEEPTFALEVEDANGEKITINAGDDLEQVLADFEPKSNGQIFKILQDVMRLEGEKQAHDAQQAESTERAEYEAKVAKVQAGWDAEIEALQGEKRLSVKEEERTERVNEVFKFIAEENAKRSQSDRPLIQSFEDALDKLELREKKEAEAEAKKEAKTQQRRNGGLVGGSSAPATSGAPVYRGGARNANEALRQIGAL